MRIGLESDFKDYYDNCFETDPSKIQAVYKRLKSDIPSKGRGLSILKKMGVPVLKLEATRDIMFFGDEQTKRVVVYTDPNKHDGNGRVLMKLSEAQLTYPNSLATEYYEDVTEISKLLYIGSRRFKVLLRTKGGLDRGEVVHVSEIGRMYNYMIAMPIFSIDYIPTSNGLLAMTLNTVERLEEYGLNKIMTPEEVINEISLAMLEYKITE